MNAPGKLPLLSRFVLRPSAWDENAAKWSRTIPHDHPGDFAALLKRKCSEGSWQVRHVEKDGAVVGFVVFDVEEPNDCPAELVIVALAGRDGSDMSEEVLPELHGLGREFSCQTMRFHTMRAGLIRKAERHGFRVSEIILRSDVKPL